MQPISTSRSPVKRVEAGGFGIEDDLAHSGLPEGESVPPLRHLSNTRRECRAPGRGRARFPRGIHHEIRAAALFRVGHLPRQERRRAAPRRCRAPARARAARRPAPRPPPPHRPRLSPPVSNSSGISSTATLAPLASALARNFCSAARTSGCTIASSRFKASALPTTAPQACRDRPCRLAVVPGNAASIGATASPS